MKATELRIGNYVNRHLEGQIDTVSAPDFAIFCKELDWFEKMKPIPLTEEWLVKFGFTNYEWCTDCAFIKLHSYHMMVRFFNDGWHITKTRVSMDKEGHKSGGHKNIVKKGFIKHVHQLQNLYFALTGKELTIKE